MIETAANVRETHGCQIDRLIIYIYTWETIWNLMVNANPNTEAESNMLILTC